ncbi:MAG: VIT and VWA domain-containing protein [Sedimentisphaerales bacterium]|nr:VIT and VWA domain-containing protein [Sedimentisphaerales bacterium]
MRNSRPSPILFCILATTCIAQPSHVGVRPPAANVIIPQGRPYGLVVGGNPCLRITGVEALIDIFETTATTTIQINIENTTRHRQEAELVIPVPEGVVVRGFAYDGPSGQIEAVVLPKEQARRIYRELVSKIRDPALLEFAGYNLIRTSVFPVEPLGKQRIRLTYEHILRQEGNRIDYILPRSESLQYDVPWEFTVNIRSRHPISTVYCPSHTVHTKHMDQNVVSVKVEREANAPGPFRLSYVIDSEPQEIAITTLAFPDPELAGGYFLVLAGTGKGPQADANTLDREVILVIDRSGSMQGRKVAQAKEAALQVLSGLRPGEAFNLIIYSDSVELFSPRPVLKDEKAMESARSYIQSITAVGGTNLYDALKTALKQPVTEGKLPLVLFLTDGLPTVGATDEPSIRQLAIKSNPHRRRVFTFGVGLDVNAALLQALADLTRAKAEFVLPDEDVEVKVGRVFAQLTGPVLAEPQLRVMGGDRLPTTRVRDLLPPVIPDLFESDQLVLLGQYIGNDPISFELCGQRLSGIRTYRFTLDPAKADKAHAFIPRLWASRKIAQLIDQIRQMGAEGQSSPDDPKMKELTDQIVQLSTKFGILTEYTAFLAKEGTDLHRHDVLVRQTAANLNSRAVRMRSGAAGVSQGLNIQRQMNQMVLNHGNMFLNERMEPVRINTVQQFHDLAFYNRANQWIDARLVGSNTDLKPDRIVDFGTTAFWDLVDRLEREGRQASLAFSGEVLLWLDGQTVLVRMPAGASQ